jgi:hypothetical protein
MSNAAFEKGGNIITPKGRMVYPSLFKPSLPPGEKDEDKARFNATLLIPADADYSALTNAVEKLIEENVPAAKRKSVKRPFLNTADSNSLDDYAEEYPIMIRCAAKFAPDVVTPNAQRTFKEEEEADEVYGGRHARFSVRPYFWSHKTGGMGVSFGLQNAQMLDHGDAIAGGRVRGTSEFESAGEDELAGM